MKQREWDVPTRDLLDIERTAQVDRVAELEAQVAVLESRLRHVTGLLDEFQGAAYSASTALNAVLGMLATDSPYVRRCEDARNELDAVLS